jgi:transposase
MPDEAKEPHDGREGRSPPRRRWSEAEKRRIVAESCQAGVSVSAVARRHDLNTNQLFTWRRRFRELAGDAGAGGFVPVVVEASPGDGPGAATMSSPSGDVVAAGGRMEIALPGGVRVTVDRDVDGRALARVLAVLEGR